MTDCSPSDAERNCLGTLVRQDVVMHTMPCFWQIWTRHSHSLIGIHGRKLWRQRTPPSGSDANNAATTWPTVNTAYFVIVAVEFPGSWPRVLLIIRARPAAASEAELCGIGASRRTVDRINVRWSDATWHNSSTSRTSSRLIQVAVWLTR